MRIVILRSAIEDLVRGREFYEKQGEGLGDYFDEALAADIDSLHLSMPASMPWRTATTVCSPPSSRTGCTTRLPRTRFGYEPSSTADVIQNGYGLDCGTEWPTPVQYRIHGDTFILRSAGRDRKFDTKDDIHVP